MSSVYHLPDQKLNESLVNRAKNNPRGSPLLCLHWTACGTTMVLSFATQDSEWQTCLVRVSANCEGKQQSCHLPDWHCSNN